MKLKILSKRTLLIVGITVFIFSVALLLYFFPKNPVKANSTLSAEDAVALPTEVLSRSGLPVRLKIPEISVDATVEYVGLTADGLMDVPKSPADVAWLNLGPRPGENGSAVIAGHYGIWKNGEGSVFDNLKKLSKGGKLYVEDDQGTTTTFVVRESRSYNPEEDASDVFSSSDRKSHLNLITCESWDKVSESYSKRLVVFADKE